MQTSYSNAEYASQEKLTRRDCFPGEIEAAMPWPALVADILPCYPEGDGCVPPPMSLERRLRLYIAQQCFGSSNEGVENATGPASASASSKTIAGQLKPCEQSSKEASASQAGTHTV